MRCTVCQAPDVSAKDNGVVVCWCGEDLCQGCVEPHTAGCEWYRNQRVKPEKQMKRVSLEKRSKRREKRR